MLGSGVLVREWLVRLGLGQRALVAVVRRPPALPLALGRRVRVRRVAMALRVALVRLVRRLRLRLLAAML